MAGRPLERVIGSSLLDYVASTDRDRLRAMIAEGSRGDSTGEIGLSGAGSSVPVYLSFNALQIDDVRIVCLIVTDLSEQKRAEEILVAETLARAILEQAAEGIVVVDREGRIIRASQAAIALAGQDVMLRQFTEVFPFHADGNSLPGIASARDLCAAASEGQTIKGFEVVLPRISKPPAYLISSAGPLLSPKGEPLGCVITLTDMTAHRETEGELHASEERRRLAVEAASIGTWNWDLRTNRQMASRESFALFGLEPGGDMAPERFLTAIHPSDRERVGKEIAAALRGDAGYDTEYRVVWPDGSIHWVASRGSVEFDSGGEPVRMQGTALNVDDRKRMEEEVRQASDTVKAVIAGSPVAIWLVDSHGKVAIWNAAAESLFGYGVDDVISKPGLFHLKSPSGDEILMRLAEGEVIVGLEAVCEKKGGGRVDVSFSTSSLHNDDGTSRGFVALAVDVTERKRLDEQMRQTQKLESIGLLAGGIAHDFNNLLTGIIGNASLLTADPLCSDWRTRLDEIVKTGERAASLTKQLLAYAGKGHFYLQPVNLTAVVRALLPLIKTSLPTKSEMTLELDDTLPAIHSDRSQIEQVLMNLVINAGEALGDSPGRITVRTCMQELGDAAAARFGMEPGQYCCLEVIDTGCGMDEITRSRVFEPFFSTKFTGRGLGLAAVHGIVRSCKGMIRVESQQGRGARFSVFFPTVMGTVAGDAGEARSSLPRVSGVVLVVDDEEMVRSVAKGALEKFGLKVILAANGVEAVERFREAAEQIDAVLLDIKMPVMDGYETLKQLRRVRPDVEVLISSGFGEEEAVRNFRGQGITGYVQKPYRAPALVEAVQSAVKRGRTRPQTRFSSLPTAD
jgi:PAS domain S-box-containing protein